MKKPIAGIHLIALVVLFFTIFGIQIAHADSPTPTNVKTTSTFPASDAFAGETPSKFEPDPSKFKTFQFSSCGEKFTISGYEISPGQILVPIGDPNFDTILGKFDVGYSFDSDTKILTIIREKTKISLMKIDYEVADIEGKKKNIPIPPRIIDGKVYISPSSLSKAIWCFYSYDEKKSLYYMDCWVLDVFLETSKRGKVNLVAKGTGDMKYRILKLRDPTRFVIDVMNSCLDGKAREIQHPTLGAIRVSQHQLMGEEGNIVRIVIPQSEDTEIVMEKPRAQNYVEANLRPTQSLAPVQDLPIQKITDLDVSENDKLVTITLTTTGPIQLEWTRLLDPDNRFFIDIPGTIYPDKKKDFNLKSEFLPTIRVAQFKPAPDPMVRMVLGLESPNEVVIGTDPKNPNKLKITVSKNRIDPDKTARKGFIISYYPSKGLIICIDPGHGGSDSGAVNKSLGLYEKDVTLDVAKRLKTLLQKEGWTVAMTRNSDRDVSYPGATDYEELAARTSLANDIKADVFVSIHINASTSGVPCGISTYWYKWEDKSLATHIQNALIEGTGRKNLGIRRERFHVVRRTKMPAVLVELCFISNAAEAKLLDTPQFRQKAAEAIMNGLRAYAHQHKLQGGSAPNSKNPSTTNYLWKKKKAGKSTGKN